MDLWGIMDIVQVPGLELFDFSLGRWLMAERLAPAGSLVLSPAFP